MEPLVQSEYKTEIQHPTHILRARLCWLNGDTISELRFDFSLQSGYFKVAISSLEVKFEIMRASAEANRMMQKMGPHK